MTSRLSLLRSRLARLGRVRGALRAAAAWSAVGASVVLVGLAVFAIDFWFRLAVAERLAMLLVGAGVMGWSYWRFARPLIGQAEPLTQTALFVERQQQIDSDLVAALQFDAPQTKTIESAQLAGAVVDYVVTASPGIRVFQGLIPAGLVGRMLVLAGCFAGAIGLVSLAPRHAAVFANRVLLGSQQYPTRTKIEQVFVNRTLVFAANQGNEKAMECNAAQGQPLRFFVKCEGSLPTGGSVDLVAATGTKARNRLELHAVSAAERLKWLRDAAARVHDAQQSAPSDIVPRWREDLLALVQCDAAEAVATLLAVKRTDELKPVAEVLERAIRDLPEGGNQTVVLAGEISRLNDDLSYRIAAGDAATESADVILIPLPIVQLDVIPHPPEYARESTERVAAHGSQLVVLEGSTVEARVTSTNKPLESVWFTVQQNGGTERVAFVPIDAERRVWVPAADKLVTRKLTQELRYELQVVDVDGLSLETPIRGALRLRTDKLPLAVASVIHKAVLPTATPVVGYRVNDDFGIGRATLTIETERGQSGDLSAANATTPGESASSQPSIALPAVIERKRFDVLSSKDAVVGEHLPLVGTFTLPLSELNLLKGDRLKVTLEVRDYRGEDEAGQQLGEITTSEPVVLEIADESGVLAAIVEADKRSEQQLNEMIQRQLGTGGERP